LIRKRNLPLVLIFLLVGSVEIGWGYYAAHLHNYMQGDAISRVANAFYILYSRDPHLGAIGFIWNPLPSILELIPLLFWKVIPEMAASGIASVVVTACFNAGTCTLLYHNCRKNNVPVVFTLLILAGFICNPFIFLYGANGMSEMMFVFSIVWLITSFTDWVRHERISSLIQVGLSLAMGFWIRYEAVAIGVAATICLIIALYLKSQRSANSKKSSSFYSRLQSSLLIVLMPPVFSGFVWVLLNYLMMGDPLYFLRSGYSNTAFVQDLSAELLSMKGNFMAIIPFAARKMLFFIIPFAVLLLCRMITKKWANWDMIVLALLVFSIPAMQAAMLFQGASYGWLRFFVYPFAVTIAWLPYEWTQIDSKRYAKMVFAILCAALLCSSAVIRDMNDQSFAPEEYGSLHMEQSQTTQEMITAREIAQYLDHLIESRGEEPTLILTDSFRAFAIIVNSKYPDKLAITNDRDFKTLLSDPQKNGVDFILVPKVDGTVLQVIHEHYPEMFDGGIAWTEFVEDFNGAWRLYSVLPGEGHR